MLDESVSKKPQVVQPGAFVILNSLSTFYIFALSFKLYPLSVFNPGAVDLGGGLVAHLEFAVVVGDARDIEIEGIARSTERDGMLSLTSNRRRVAKDEVGPNGLCADINV